MNFLNELTSFSKKSLKPAVTQIYYSDGRKCILNKDNDQEYEEIEVGLSADDLSPDNPARLSRLSGHVTDMYADLSVDQIVDRLYLSGDDAATNRSILAANRITHIINITSNVANKFEKELTYMKIHLYDLANQDILKHFEDTFNFIETALNASPDNSVLVHCNQGVSRSATIVIAYLMQKSLYPTYKQAYEHVKQKRTKIKPNAGFVEQLNRLEQKLQSKNETQFNNEEKWKEKNKHDF